METENVTTCSERGIPGMCGIEHVGLTVPNLEEATAFFVDVLRCEVVYSFSPPSHTGNYLDIHPDAKRKIRTLRCLNGAHFELFEYDTPDQNCYVPKVSDLGGYHVAFYLEIRGSLIYEHPTDYPLTINLIASGKLTPGATASDPLPLENAALLLEAMAAGRLNAKSIVSPHDSPTPE